LIGGTSGIKDISKITYRINDNGNNTLHYPELLPTGTTKYHELIDPISLEPIPERNLVIIDNEAMDLEYLIQHIDTNRREGRPVKHPCRTNIELSHSLITSIYELYNRRDNVPVHSRDRVLTTNMDHSSIDDTDNYSEIMRRGRDYAREISRRVRDEMRQEHLAREQERMRRLERLHLRQLPIGRVSERIPHNTDFVFEHNNTLYRGRIHRDVLPGELLRQGIYLWVGQYSYNIALDKIIGYSVPTDPDYIAQEDEVSFISDL
jgi:hypothetical protein